MQSKVFGAVGIIYIYTYHYISNYIYISHLKSPSFREVDPGRWSKHVEIWANMSGDWTLGSVRLGETLSSKKPGLPGFDGLVQF